MDDYSGLAARAAAGVGGLRGCLILSRDGLVLGAHPDDDEGLAKPSWLRFATLGEPERSFVEFPDQVWVYVHRGPYAAFAVADAGVRPGLVIDQLEQALLTAEESRTRRDGLRAPDAAAAAAGPRTTTAPARPRRRARAGGRAGRRRRRGRPNAREAPADGSAVRASASATSAAVRRRTTIPRSRPEAPAAAPAKRRGARGPSRRGTRRRSS